MKEVKPEPLAKKFLVAQGSCCGSGCVNCPYVDEQGRRYQVGTTTVESRNQETENGCGLESDSEEDDIVY